MHLQEVMNELKLLGKERTKKIYLSNGAQEPLFGVATGAMKPLAKQIKINQALADELFNTGNYDAMYFAGIIADAKNMTKDDFDRWIDQAYFYMISDYIVAVTLAESPLAQQISDKWIASNKELKQSAGWSSYCWQLGNQKDDNFDKDKLLSLLKQVKSSIHKEKPRVQIAMNMFVTTVAISYIPLHEQALEIAQEIGSVEVIRENKPTTVLNAYETILKDIDKNRVGFKRKYVRC